MKTRSIRIFIGLVAAGVACAQTAVTLQYGTYYASGTSGYADYPCTQPALTNPVSTATGFTVTFG
ncbi:MAG: hypothetical protein WBL61_19945 [Bryobacteraceae bacterium]